MTKQYPEHVTGAAAISSTVTPDIFPARLASVEISITATPTTSEDLVISLVRGGGATTEILRVDPSEGAETNYSLRLIPDVDIELHSADTLTVALTNTDTKTVSATFIFEKV